MKPKNLGRGQARKISYILEQAREKVENLLSTHKPMPLSDEVEKELDKIQKRANQSSE